MSFFNFSWLFCLHKILYTIENDKTVGFRYNLLICDDQHNYGEESSLNIGEVIKVKIEDVNSNTNFTFGQKVELINPRASIYGEYQNQLSVKADNVVLKKSK